MGVAFHAEEMVVELLQNAGRALQARTKPKVDAARGGERAV